MKDTRPENASGFIPVNEAFGDDTEPQKSAYLRTDEIATYSFRLRPTDPVEVVKKADYEGAFAPSNRDAWNVLHCIDDDGKDLKIDCKSAALYHLFAQVWSEFGLSKSSIDPLPESQHQLVEFELEVVVPSNPALKKAATLRLTATVPDGKSKTWAV